MGCDWLIGGLGGAFSPSEAHVSIMDAARVPSQCPEGEVVWEAVMKHR